MDSRHLYKTRNDKTRTAESHHSQSTSQSTALTAVALQDHLIRSLSLGNPLRPHHRLPLGSKAKKRPVVKSVVDTGRNRAVKKSVSVEAESKEYVLDPKPAPLTLAQKYGLVESPAQPLTEAEWGTVKEKSNKREDSRQPCVICKEEFGTQEQVLLSCTHVFHRSCLQAFERFTGKKTCPMCRKEEYQTRVIHEGCVVYRQTCATRIQAAWRGYIVRCWYNKLRETIPPKDPALRKKFYEEKLHKITDRMIRSLDCDINGFLHDIDRDLEASRDVFRHFDDIMKVISDEEWEQIQLKAVERGHSECPICLTALEGPGLTPETSRNQERSEASNKITKGSSQNKLISPSAKHLSKSCSKTETVKPKGQFKGKPSTGAKSQGSCQIHRESILLSCSHVFHKTCLEAFEEFAVGERHHSCPVCRTHYQKKVL